ncbi:MAG TPA: LptF/LptG family permease [Verrucomicrobiae bacterium]|nr:LptF/LptG family permease [Verrucomicrobiae bacterium]
MKTLHFYLLRQVIASLLMTVIVFTFVLLLGNLLKEILGLLVNGQASLGTVFQAIALLVPFVWVFALPMGMLTATLLVFGRFSADQELTAARAGGISLISLASPILVLSLLLSGLSAWVNMDLGPNSREKYKDLLFKFTTEISSAQLPEGRYIRDFPGYMFYIGKNRGGGLEDVWVYKLGNSTNSPSAIFAPRGKLAINKTNLTISVQLFEAKGVLFKDGHPTYVSNAEWTLEEFKIPGMDLSRKASLRDMSFRELLAELRELESDLSKPLELVKPNDPKAKEKRAAIQEQMRDLTSPARVQLHRQVAFSFACFGFTLIGIPLGIRVHRRETNVGFAIAIVLVLVYYAGIMLGLSLAKKPEFLPHLILWVPNFIFQVVGAVLLWRANRGL